ncbi:MAG: hypothetical protein IRY92_02935 [Dactylosporangium sp.]|nr:hypothetical protein [Dactylosporangium sp.]
MTRRIRRGEVYDWASPAGPRRVVVLSEDLVNEHSWPVCALIVRTGQPSLFLVACVDADPVGGLVAVNTLGATPPGELGERPVGMLTGTTMQRVEVGLRALLGL